MLAARIGRIQALVESIEAKCAQSAEQREMLQVLKRELDECRAALKTIE